MVAVTIGGVAPVNVDTLAYVSGGNTYIVTSKDNATAENSIKLVGVTTDKLAIASGTDLTLA